jgi:hypothetical protein
MSFKITPFVGKINVNPPIVILPPVWLLGQGIPSDDLGENGNFYIDTLTYDIYQKENGSWL